MNLPRSGYCIFQESTAHKLSIDALFVYHYTMHEDKRQVIPGA